MRFIIVTGLSGAGKITALRVFEDNGYYCADNLPIELIGTFADLIYSQSAKPAMSAVESNTTNPQSTAIGTQSGKLDKVAIGVDIRSGKSLDKLDDVLSTMRQKGQKYEMLFLDCDDETLIKRFKETRRSHPMNEHKSVAHGIKIEREELEFLRRQSDYIINTSNLLVRELRKELENIFVANRDYKNLFITILSFGFKYGIPTDSDLVFDVRFLPNPYYEENLKEKTGENKEVQDFVMESNITKEFFEQLTQMMKFLIPNYISEGKNQLVVGIGCTGGQHRSVTIANELFKALDGKDIQYGIKVAHRDLSRKVK